MNMVTILIMSAKMGTLINVFWKRVYEVIISVNDVNKKIFLRESNYIVDVAMGPKFGNYSTSMTEVIKTSFLYRFDQKNNFFWGMTLVQVQPIGTGSSYRHEILYQRGKRVKTKSQKVLGASLYVFKNWWWLSRWRQKNAQDQVKMT